MPAWRGRWSRGCADTSDGQTLNEVFDQGCEPEPWVLSDEHGFGEDNRWRIGAGNLDGDACDDLLVRSNTHVYQLLSKCETPAFELGPETGLVFRGPLGVHPGWSEGLHGSMHIADVDGDGLDDIIANGPYGAQVHINQNDQELPYATVGGLDPERARAALPYVDVDDWSRFSFGRFDGAHLQFISLGSLQLCLDLWWLFD